MTDEQPAANDGGEFEREPVPARRLLGFGSFVGMYAGEHCAGTELMIGPLFVAAGVSAFDLIVGLLLGNALAVLSWTLLTAPIATRARLTLYYQLEKITGRKLVTAYSLANGAMFCILAGSMITVSATALGVWFDFRMPELNQAMPNSVGWVVAVFAIGVAFTAVAAFGYEALARFANLAAPWMVVLFFAFAIIGLRQFIDATDAKIESPGDLWNLCKTTIWKGGEPFPGQNKFTLAHVTFFAWFCNMAMHIGMSDLSVFRFAKKSWYGVATASGMYLGHFVAWIAAALLFAYQLHEMHPDEHLIDLLVSRGGGEYSAEELRDAPLTPELISRGMKIENDMVDAGEISPEQKQVKPPPPLPGPLANNALGVAGLICVIVAGWTTANPTIYRSGLAFQAMFPKASRVSMTIATGMLATFAGMFPLVAMKLLDFVALYGLLLMPMGAVIFVDFWLMPKLGLKDRYAERVGSSFNMAAAAAWVVTIVICGGIAYVKPHLLFFVSLPGWFLASAIYIAMSAVLQRSAAAKSASKEWT
jgi:purine-cytosine permease-like protein